MSTIAVRGDKPKKKKQRKTKKKNTRNDNTVLNTITEESQDCLEVDELEPEVFALNGFGRRKEKKWVLEEEIIEEEKVRQDKITKYEAAVKELSKIMLKIENKQSRGSEEAQNYELAKKMKKAFEKKLKNLK